MKKKKPLQNPVVVIALCGVAAAALYFNTIAPLLKGDEEYYVEEEVEETPEEAAVPATNETAEAVTGAVTEAQRAPPPTIQTVTAISETSAGNDSTAAGALYTLKWRRKTDRNPFRYPEKKVTADTALQTDTSKTALIKKTSAVKKRKMVKRAWKKIRNTTREPEQPPVPLYAISRGPSGWLALIGSEMVKVGDTCSVGVIAAIDRTSVTVRKYGKLQVITLINRNRE